MEFRFYDPSNPATVTKGHLPHWEQENSTYFITWRTADSIPREKADYWTQQREDWLRAHAINPGDPEWRKKVEVLPEDIRRELRRFSRAVDDEMDSCHGECLLRDPDLARIVARALHHFDGDRYLLGDFVVMPNHVHVLVGGMDRGRMQLQVGSWKKWTALEINQRTRRKGRFWQTESFDHLVRSESAFERFRRYIGENPAKAKLREGEYVLWQSK
ncbi:transposase [Haloferula sp. BvORR071]|uniref:transposase n=1 Tax=Haloferula sp. BvORR071 TaxID=1396141 RepID=UPI000556DC42|nr:transposase [Haloferula sp. BvORR071]